MAGVTSIPTANKARESRGRTATSSDPGGYVLPVLHTRIPEKAVDLGFWGGLFGGMVFGAIDAPLGVLIGAGVLVARHRRTH
jgi:hypothetical protein